MKYLNYFLLVAGICLLAQCTRPDPVEIPLPSASVETTVVSFAVTPDEAAAEALAAREALSPATRSQAVAVSSVARHAASAAASDPAQVDPSLYVVNFADQGGFAIVAADRRQHATVYAVSDRGAFPDPATLEEGTLKFLFRRIETLAAAPTEIEKSTFYHIGPWTDIKRADRLVQMRWGTGAPFYGSAHSAAICQIMAFHRWPLKYDWNTITSLVCALDLHRNDPARDAKIKALFADVNETMQGTELNTNFGKLDYFCNASEPYTVGKILSEVDASRPVYAHGQLRRGCLMFGYTWIMDGYVKQNRICTPINPQPDPIGFTSDDPGMPQAITSGYSKIELRTLIHCNLGNDGIGNGYYLSTVFDLGSGAVIPDNDALPQDNPIAGQTDYDASTIAITTHIRPKKYIVVDPSLPVIEQAQFNNDPHASVDAAQALW